MTDTDPTTSFEIEGEGIDAETLGQELQIRSRARKAEAEAQGLDYEGLAQGLRPLPAVAVFSRDLYEAVGQVGFGADKVSTELDLTETRVAVVGGMVHRFRAAIHELVLFYLNRFEARQVRFNDQTAQALAVMVRDLEAEVRDLRARLVELEADQE